MQSTEASIKPNELYDLAKAAEILGISPAQFKKRWIFTGKMIFTPNGHGYTLLGENIIRAMAREGTTWQESELPTDPIETISSLGGEKTEKPSRRNPKQRLD